MMLLSAQTEGLTFGITIDTIHYGKDKTYDTKNEGESEGCAILGLVQSMRVLFW